MLCAVGNMPKHGIRVTRGYPRGIEMPKAKLTAPFVERRKEAPGVRVDYFDSILPGFVLRVSGPTPKSPDGSRSWGVFYRIGGKLVRETIGSYPALELGAARDQARARLQLVEKGIDPREQKKVAAATVRPPDSVEPVVAEFIKRHLGPKRAESYVRETRRIFDKYVLPQWGDRDIKS